MRCGNCKNEHKTVNEVIGCYHASGTQVSFTDKFTVKKGEVTRTPPPASVMPGLTKKQADYVVALLSQVGKTEADLPTALVDMNRKEASEVITALKIEKVAIGHTKRDIAKPSGIKGEQVQQGTYTVVFDDDSRITVRFREPKTGKWMGNQLVEFLFGPDNESDFRRCGNWTGDGYRIWAMFRDDGRINRAVTALSSDDEGRLKAGMQYALESSNCWRCGRKLTVPASIHRGLGPECAQIVG